MAMRYYAPFPGGPYYGDGVPPRQRGPQSLRIGDAERDAAAADLGEHYAAGRLTLDELDERLDAVFTAKTFGQLARLMADLPGPGRLAWHAGPGVRHGLGAHVVWGPSGFPYDVPFGVGAEPWHSPHPAHPAMARFQPSQPQPPTQAERAGRFAALSLLLLAMLIWLFTALLFARHGIAHPSPYGPPGPFDHYQPARLLPQIQAISPSAGQ